MIIANIETLKRHIATVVGDNFDKYKPYLETAETWLKREITGLELFALVTSQHEELLNFSEAVIAHKAYHEAIPFLDVAETENGFAIISTENLVPASPQRVQALIKATAERFGECVEDLLEYLESSEDEIQDAWKSSKSYTLVNDNYVKSIRQFRQYAVFEGGRLEWIGFKPKLTRARKLKIEPVISRELSEQIIEQLRDEEIELTAGDPHNNDVILEDLRFALAAYASDDEASGASFVARVRDVLIAAPDNYPAFKTSAIYQAYLAQLPRDNTQDPFMICGV
jgi:hypothetical protein